MNRSKMRRACRSALPAVVVGASVLAATMTASSPASAATSAPATGASIYLNLHQCTYSGPGGSLYTNLLPNTPNTAFNTGTQVSGTVQPTVNCGPGSGVWTLNTANSAVFNGDRLGSGARYLNLHQCTYNGPGGSLYTNHLPNTPNRAFNTGTSVSGTAETTLSCGPGSGVWTLNTANSAVYTIDLTGNSGRYLNLDQCTYNGPGGSLYSNLLPNTPNTPFNTGTSVSATPQTTLSCGPGSGAWTLNTANSAVYTIDLAA
jgi:hypothetical protein